MYILLGIFLASLILSVLGLPQARIGVAIKIAIIAGLLLMQLRGGATIPS